MNAIAPAPSVSGHIKAAGNNVLDAGKMGINHAQDAWKHLSARVQADGLRNTAVNSVKNHKLGAVVAGTLAIGAVAAIAVNRHRHTSYLRQQEAQRGTDISR